MLRANGLVAATCYGVQSTDDIWQKSAKTGTDGRSASAQFRLLGERSLKEENGSKAVLSAYSDVIEALAPLFLASGIGSKEVERVTRQAFVRGIEKLERAGGREPSDSLISMRTKLHRHDVAKCRKEGGVPADTVAGIETLRINWALREWHFDPDYMSGDSPRDLEFESTEQDARTFQTLVQTYVPDVYPGLLKRELLRVKAVVELPDGRLRPLVRVYNPAPGLNGEAIREVGYRLRDLTNTLLYNLLNKKQRRVCRTVQTVKIGESSLSNVRRALQETSKAAAERIYQIFSNRKWARKVGERQVLLTWNCHSAEEILAESCSDEPERNSTAPEPARRRGARRARSST